MKKKWNGGRRFPGKRGEKGEAGVDIERECRAAILGGSSPSASGNPASDSLPLSVKKRRGKENTCRDLGCRKTHDFGHRGTTDLERSPGKRLGKWRE